MIVLRWTAPTLGDSPIDEYEARAVPIDGDPPAPTTVIQYVSASSLVAYLTAQNQWSGRVAVRAHNAAGWGAWSAPLSISGV